jgi:hypothetical protein
LIFPCPLGTGAEEGTWLSKDVDFMGLDREEATQLLQTPFDEETHTFHFQANGCQVSVHPRPDFRVKPGTAFLCAEHDMDNDLAEGLRHRSAGYLTFKLNSQSQPAKATMRPADLQR